MIDGSGRGPGLARQTRFLPESEVDQAPLGEGVGFICEVADKIARSLLKSSSMGLPIIPIIVGVRSFVGFELRMVKRAKSLVRAAKAEMPGFIKPQLATLKMKAPAGDRIHEIKYDGCRAQVYVDRGATKIFTCGQDTGAHGYVQ
ncbi:hypothetical protein ACVWWG_005413 [Bradyrhizobium sp. LB7.2]